MRLINTSTLQLTEYPESKLPERGYAILSHRWLDSSEEVTFDDLQQNRDVSHKAGFAKLKSFCAVSASKGYEYAWCDTCCIDKASAVELGSAINSMYRWYKNAKICVTYLQDVSSDGGVAFQDSEWFRRGWTLQELIAPTYLEFFDQSWDGLGTKQEHVRILSATTGIPESVLKDVSKLSRCSIAQRMSWASNRTTERVEDRTYSLLGLFDVSLEMIYGEEDKAFVRLQEKLIQHSADQSIFAWTMDADESENKACGLLATSPSRFHACGDVSKGEESQAFSMTNLGLSISLPTLPYDIETYLAFLACSLERNPPCYYAILLSRLSRNGQWGRVSINGLSVFHPTRCLIDEAGTIQTDVCVPQSPTAPPIRDNQVYGFWLRELTLPHDETAGISIASRIASPAKDRVLLQPNTFGTAGIICFAPSYESYKWPYFRWIRVGFDDSFQPIIKISEGTTFSNTRGGAIPTYWTLMDFNEAESRASLSSGFQQLFDNHWLRPETPGDERHTSSIEETGCDRAITLTHQRHYWPSREYEYPEANLRIGFSLVPDVRPDAEHGSSKLIWAIDITKMRELAPGPNMEKCKTQLVNLGGSIVYHVCL